MYHESEQNTSFPHHSSASNSLVIPLQKHGSENVGSQFGHQLSLGRLSWQATQTLFGLAFSKFVNDSEWMGFTNGGAQSVGYACGATVVTSRVGKNVGGYSGQLHQWRHRTRSIRRKPSFSTRIWTLHTEPTIWRVIHIPYSNPKFI